MRGIVDWSKQFSKIRGLFVMKSLKSNEGNFESDAFWDWKPMRVGVM